MSWVAVARKDFQDAIRSKVLWALSVLFVLFAAGITYVYTLLLNGSGPQVGRQLTALGLILFMATPVAILIPLTAIVVGYKSVSGEVASGTIKLALSLPHTRSDVVVGKLVGRTLVLSVPIVVGFVVAAVEAAVLYASFELGSYVLFLLLTVLFGMAYVAVALGISASTKSTTKAATGVFAVFVLFQFLWNYVPLAVYYLLNGTFFIRGRPPNWFYFFERLSPQNAYNGVMMALLPNQQAAIQQQLGGSVPFYLSSGFALVILVAWIVVPVAVGYWRFEAMDL